LNSLTQVHNKITEEKKQEIETAQEIERQKRDAEIRKIKQIASKKR